MTHLYERRCKPLLLFALSLFGTSLALAGDLETERSFDIPPQPLDSALLEFSAQADIQLIVAAESVAGITSPGVSGQQPAESALMALLDDTGLWYDTVGSTVTVVSADAAESSPPGKSRPAPRQSRMARTATPAENRTRPASRQGLSSEQQEHGDLEEIVVVGTLLRDVSPTSPVISYDREDIVRGGYTTTQDILDDVSQNFSGITTSTGMQTGYYTTNQIDLRGLGPESTLTLVDGRRVSRAAGHEGRAVDISMIPVSAIERVDILTDGASALYGSDAVAGVVNIVLRDDFEGAQTTLHYGRSAAGVDTLLASQLLGLDWESGRALAAVQYRESDALRFSELGISTSDLRSQGGGDFRFSGAGSPGTAYPLGFFVGAPFSTITGPGGAPVFSAALPDGDGRSLQIGDLALNGTSVLDFLPEELTPEQKGTSLYVTVEQDAGAVTLFADAVFSERDYTLSALAPVSYLVVPPSNAFSPFAEPVLVGYQLTEFSYPNTWENSGWFANVGARGDLGGDNWTWEVVGSISRDESRGGGFTYDSVLLNERLASPDPAFAFNPFGNGSGQSPGVRDALVTDTYSLGETSARSATALLQGDIVDLPGGSVQLAMGAEYRRDELYSVRGSHGRGTLDTQFAEHSQKASAVFAEAYVPLIGQGNARPGVRELAVSVAGRYASYNDFGDTFNPKLGLLWRPVDDLSLKANWGTSFRAPSLRELYYPASVNETASIFDPHAPGGPRDVFARLVLGGNPELEPETADTFSLGGEYRPRWLDGLQLTVGWYRIDYEKRIRGSGDGLTQALLLEHEDSLPQGIIVRDTGGNLVAISTAYVNSANTVISGFDFSGNYSWEVDGWGTFGLTAAATVIESYDDQIVPGAPVQKEAGIVGAPPEWRGRIGFSWSEAAWGASLDVNHTDGLWLNATDPRIVTRNVDSQTTVDLQLSFAPVNVDSSWLQGLAVRAGARNLFDTESPFVDGPFNFGIGAQNFTVDGRTLYLQLSKAFGQAAR